MIAPQQLDSLDPQTRQAVLALMAELSAKDDQLRHSESALRDQREQLDRAQRDGAFKQALIDKLTHEMAVLKRQKFATTSEKFTAGLDAEQKSLLEDALDADIAEVEGEIERALDEQGQGKKERNKPKRQALPANLPRHDVRHEPQNTVCGCGCQMKRIGQDVSEKLDYVPGVFSVERHIRGKWVCTQCQTLVQAPVPAHIIDKGIPTTGLLAQVLVAKFLDHLPLYRQEHIFERAGMAIARSTLAQWVGECGAQLQPLVDALSAELLRHAVLHADETPVPMLKPGNKKTHKAYVWSFCTTPYNPVRAVVFKFSPTRAGENVREFLRQDTDTPWTGTLVTDGYRLRLKGVEEVLSEYLFEAPVPGMKLGDELSVVVDEAHAGRALALIDHTVGEGANFLGKEIAWPDGLDLMILAGTAGRMRPAILSITHKLK